MHKKSILAFGAHADDIDLRAGATLAKYAQRGYQIIYVTVTTSASGIANLSPNESFLIRQTEAMNAAAIYPAKAFFLNFQQCIYPEGPSDKLPKERRLIKEAASDPASIELIAQFIRQYQPEIILTHNADDLHEDHHYTAILIKEAWRLSFYPVSTPRLLLWEEGSRGATTIFTPNVFIEVSEKNLQLKQAAIQQHISQCQRSPQFAAHARTSAIKWQHQSGYLYAEAFVEDKLA